MGLKSHFKGVKKKKNPEHGIKRNVALEDIDSSSDITRNGAYDSSTAVNFQQKGTTTRQRFSLLLEIVIVICCSIIFRRLWILHGVSLVLFYRLLETAFAWMMFFFDTGVFHRISHLFKTLSRSAFRETEKMFQGETIRLWIASSSIQFIAQTPDSVVTDFLREQSRHINKLLVRDTNRLVEQAEERKEMISSY